MAFSGRVYMMPDGYRLWSYRTTDTVADMLVAGYFSPAYDIFQTGDRIFASVVSGDADNPLATYVDATVFVVTAITAGGAVTVAEQVSAAALDARYLKLAADNDPLTGTLSAQSIEPVTTGTYDLGTTALKWQTLWANTARILRAVGPGTETVSIGTNSSALGCTVVTGNASATATIDIGSSGTGTAVNQCVASAVWAGPAGSTSTLEILGTSGTNLGSVINVTGDASAVGLLRFTAASSGSMNLGSVLMETGATATSIIISGDGVLNLGNARGTGGTVTLSGDTTVNLGTLLGGTLTLSGASSFNLGTIEDGASLTLSGEGGYNLAHILTGSLSITGDDCFNIGAITGSGSTVTIAGSNVQNLMAVDSGADISVSLGVTGSFLRGYSTGAATITSSGSGSAIAGYYVGRATTSVTASGIGSGITATVEQSTASSTPGAVTITSSGTGSSLLGTVTSASGGTGTATIRATGTGSVTTGTISLDSTASATIEATNTGATVVGTCLAGSIVASGVGSYAQGYTTNGGVVQATGTASKVFASVQSQSGATPAASATSSGTGSVCIGHAQVASGGTGTATLLAGTAIGAIAIGTANAGGTGVNAVLQATAQGAICIGYSSRVGTTSSLVEATATGAICLGVGNAGTVSASAIGAFARGYASSNGTISSSQGGAEASGRTIGGTISATGLGARAGGYVNSSSTSITASGDGSFANGDASGGAITASAANAVQFGTGVNNVATSLQVGDAGGSTGVWLVGSGAPGTPVDGQIWKASSIVNVRSNGQTIVLNRQSTYTQTYSTTTTTHASRTAVTITGSAGGTGNSAMVSVPDPADTPASADALRDDLVANVLPVVRDDLDDLRVQLNALKADADNTAQLLNRLIDDLQTINLVA